MGKGLDGKELGKGISQRRDGLYIARCMIAGKSVCLYGSNYQKLKKDLQQKRDELKYGRDVVADYTVSEWFDKWYTTFKAPTVKPSSVPVLKRQVVNIILPYIGDIKLRNLSSIHIQEMLNSLIADGKYARGSIAEALNRISEALASAVNNRLIDTNPAFDVKMPFNTAGTKNKVERRWLDPSEIETFLSSIRDDWYYDMFYPMIFTGMRIGEVGGLQWSDIDFEREQITLSNGLAVEYDCGVKKMCFTTLKTANSYRTIPMMGSVKDMLLRQQEKVASLNDKLGDRFRGKGEFDNLVFVTNMGSPVSRYAAEHALNRIVDRINKCEFLSARDEHREPVVFERLYPHALRHTFASIAYLSGMDVKTTQKIMGHAHLSITMDIYSHLSEEYIKEDTNKINALIDELKISA